MNGNKISGYLICTFSNPLVGVVKSQVSLFKSKSVQPEATSDMMLEQYWYMNDFYEERNTKLLRMEKCSFLNWNYKLFTEYLMKRLTKKHMETFGWMIKGGDQRTTSAGFVYVLVQSVPNSKVWYRFPGQHQPNIPALVSGSLAKAWFFW